jgi:hypothetical protein
MSAFIHVRSTIEIAIYIVRHFHWLDCNKQYKMASKHEEKQRGYDDNRALPLDNLDNPIGSLFLILFTNE